MWNPDLGTGHFQFTLKSNPCKEHQHITDLGGSKDGTSSDSYEKEKVGIVGTSKEEQPQKTSEQLWSWIWRRSALEDDRSCGGKILSGGTWTLGTPGRNWQMTWKDGKRRKGVRKTRYSGEGWERWENTIHYADENRISDGARIFYIIISINKTSKLCLSGKVLKYRLLCELFWASRGKTWSLTQQSSHEQASLAFTLYCRKVKWDGQATWHGCLMMTACQNSSYIVSTATANDQLVGKRNDPRTPLRRPSQPSTLMSPTGKFVPRIDPYVTVWFIPEQEQQKQSGSRRLRKTSLLAKAILYSPTITSTGPTYPCPECGRVLQARIGQVSHPRTHMVNQTWHHHHHHRRSYGHRVKDAKKELISR